MQFALINVDADSLTLAQMLVDAGHELILVADAGELRSALKTLGPEARFVEGWEDALAAGVDAVVVGRNSDEASRLDRLRLLLQERVPTIFVHPQSASALAYYELDMHRQATNSPLVPYEPTRHQPALELLRTLGRLEEVVIEHRAGLRSRREVLDRFVRDVGAVRRFTGPCERVSAVGMLPETTTDGRLRVQLTTESGTFISWSIGSTGHQDEAEWRAVGDGGSAVIRPAGTEWPIELTHNGETKLQTFSAGQTLQAAAAAVVVGLTDPLHTMWREAIADLELVEAVERSVRKGRTVELYHEEASEESTFKGLMAAGGCLLLLLAIGLAITAATFGRFRLVIANVWPYALLLVLAVFLGLQLLQFVFPPRRKSNE